MQSDKSDVERFYATKETFFCHRLNATITNECCRRNLKIARVEAGKRKVTLKDKFINTGIGVNRLFLCGRCENGVDVADLKAEINNVVDSVFERYKKRERIFNSCGFSDDDLHNVNIDHRQISA